MKHFFCITIAFIGLSANAQTNQELKKHFETYYELMKARGDVQGIVNAMTHLEALEPSQARRDTLAYLYVSEGRNLEALNTLGIEYIPTDSDISVEVKAIALKALNQGEKALVFYEELYKREPNPYLAYEMADLKIQLKDLEGAKKNIEYGIANVKDDMMRAFYEKQQPYQTSLKAAFLYLKGLVIFNENQEVNLGASLKLMNEALEIDPNFNMAKISREALETRKVKTN